MAIIKGENTTFSFNGTAIGQVISISGPNMVVAEVSTYALGDEEKSFRPSAAYEGGTIDIEFFFDPGLHGGIVDAITNNEDPTDCALTFDDGSGITFKAFPTSFNVTGMDEDSNLTASCTLRIQDTVAMTAGGGS